MFLLVFFFVLLLICTYCNAKSCLFPCTNATQTNSLKHLLYLTLLHSTVYILVQVTKPTDRIYYWKITNRLRGKDGCQLCYQPYGQTALAQAFASARGKAMRPTVRSGRAQG